MHVFQASSTNKRTHPLEYQKPEHYGCKQPGCYDQKVLQQNSYYETTPYTVQLICICKNPTAVLQRRHFTYLGNLTSPAIAQYFRTLMLKFVEQIVFQGAIRSTNMLKKSFFQMTHVTFTDDLRHDTKLFPVHINWFSPLVHLFEVLFVTYDTTCFGSNTNL